MAARRHPAHSLVMVHRPKPHVHRWQATCTCNWAGIPVRRKTHAEAQYRDHVAQLDRYRRQHQRAGPARPAAVTPPDELPEALR